MADDGNTAVFFGASDALCSDIKSEFGGVRRAKTVSALRRQLLKRANLLVADASCEGAVDALLEVRQRHPALPVLVVTRSKANTALRRLLSPRQVDILRSPYAPEELRLRLAALGLPIRGASRTTSSTEIVPLVATPLAALHDSESGRISAKLLAPALGLSLRELAALCDKNVQTLSKTPDSKRLQPTLQSLYRLLELLTRMTGSLPNARTWLNAPQDELDGERPLALIKQGQVEVVRDLLEMAYAGNPS